MATCFLEVKDPVLRHKTYSEALKKLAVAGILATGSLEAQEFELFFCA